MSQHSFLFQGQTLHALASGALFWPAQALLCVSDLHLGKARRYARQGGASLPPYEALDTLQRLDDALENTGARHVVCLGDSFDDIHASRDLLPEARAWITRLQAGRTWMWIEGNHDPGPVDLGGSHLAEHTLAPLTFRHIAQPDTQAEISGHYHPKVTLNAKGRRIARKCFLHDDTRLIMPAFGAYTGGLNVTAPELASLMGTDARCILTGTQALAMPLQACFA